MNHTKHKAPDITRFTESDSLSCGYRIALQIRLQYAKGYPEAFDLDAFSDSLAALGTLVSVSRDGTLVRLSLMAPDPAAVMTLCQSVGEFLTVSIENPTVIPDAEAPTAPRKPRKAFGVVAVSCGNGVRDSLMSMGADAVPDGTHPLTEDDFAAAYASVNAGTLLVFPGCADLTAVAQAAAERYTDADVRIIPAHDIGAIYAALSMLDTSSGDTDAIVADLTDTCADTVTACVTAAPDGACGYVGTQDGRTLITATDRTETVMGLAQALRTSRYDILLLFAGAAVPADEARALYDRLTAQYKRTEIILMDGGMPHTDYILSPQ